MVKPLCIVFAGTVEEFLNEIKTRDYFKNLVALVTNNLRGLDWYDFIQNDPGDGLYLDSERILMTLEKEILNYSDPIEANAVKAIFEARRLAKDIETSLTNLQFDISRLNDFLSTIRLEEFCWSGDPITAYRNKLNELTKNIN